jgi:hypothetical protein
MPRKPDSETKRMIGRPMKYPDEGLLLAPLNFRVRPGLRVAIEQAAAAAGRSMSAEIMHRLEVSFATAGTVTWQPPAD